MRFLGKGQKYKIIFMLFLIVGRKTKKKVLPTIDNFKSAIKCMQYKFSKNQLPYIIFHSNS